MSFLVEGGAVCPTGERGVFSSTYSYTPYSGPYVSAPTRQAKSKAGFGNAGCGWTGKIGLFQDKPGILFGWGDFWGVFVRHQDFKSSNFNGSGQSAVSPGPLKYYFTGIGSHGTFDEERTVLDFEVGKDIGIGSDGSKLRLFGGLRYAHYSSSLRANGNTNLVSCFGSCKYYSYPFAVRSGDTFNGFGPRLGLTGDLPLFGAFFLTGTVSGSLIWGEHTVHLNTSGVYPGGRTKFTDDGLVSNAEGEVGIGMPFLMTGGKLIVGARWEGWFDQSKVKHYDLDVVFDCSCTGLAGNFDGKGSLDRNNWGPFMRLNIPLGQPP